LLEVNASFLVIIFELWDEELLKNVQVHDIGNGRKWPLRSPDLIPLDILLCGFVIHNYPR
jgi:hypothetical protein